MRQEYGDDEGKTAAVRHRECLVTQFHKARQILDDFHPDFIVLWGDDQYENFREDIIPPFCLFAYDSFAPQPWARGAARPNAWDEPKDTTIPLRGHRTAAKTLAQELLTEGFDVSYAYKPLHDELGHAFLNTLLFLDYDRQGFDYPVLPFAVNCYGSKIIRNRGGATPTRVNGKELDADPPGPSPKRCMEVGAAMARVLQESPSRVALVASSSWSHAFLTTRNHWLWPDIESDRARFEELRAGDYDAWRSVSTSQIEEAGQQELLNWMCLAGAMSELGRRPEILDYIETYVFNSDKCLAIFKP